MISEEIDFDSVNKIIRTLETELHGKPPFFWPIPRTKTALFWNGGQLVYLRNDIGSACGRVLNAQRWEIRCELYKDGTIRDFYRAAMDFYEEGANEPAHA